MKDEGRGLSWIYHYFYNVSFRAVRDSRFELGKGYDLKKKYTVSAKPTVTINPCSILVGTFVPNKKPK